jgi:hypothetical protein
MSGRNSSGAQLRAEAFSVIDFSPQIEFQGLQEIACDIARFAVAVIARIELGDDLALPFDVPLQLAYAAHGARKKALEQVAVQQVAVHAMSNIAMDVGSIRTAAPLLQRRWSLLTLSRRGCSQFDH